LKKLITILIILAFTSSAFGAVVSLTDDQLKYIDLVEKSVRTSYPEFTGFHGTQGEMIADGVASSPMLQTYIDSIDLEALKEADDHRKDIKKIRKKFKDLGFNNKDLEVMGYTNDIPDEI